VATKRYFLGYSTVFKPSICKVTEIWRLFDRRSEEFGRSKPLHNFEIEQNGSLYDVYRYNSSIKNFEIHQKDQTSLEIAIISCLTLKEKHELIDNLVEIGFRNSP
jgi:hypothetical protein